MRNREFLEQGFEVVVVADATAAARAFANPITAGSAEAAEATVWWDSVYGTGGAHRGAVLTEVMAALAANSVDGKDIASKMQEVSGGSGDGEKATDFASAAQIILDGGVADFDGYSGPITFDENGDPTEATIGIFQYGEDNMHTRVN